MTEKRKTLEILFILLSVKHLGYQLPASRYNLLAFINFKYVLFPFWIEDRQLIWLTLKNIERYLSSSNALTICEWIKTKSEGNKHFKLDKLAVDSTPSMSSISQWIERFKVQEKAIEHFIGDLNPDSEFMCAKRVVFRQIWFPRNIGYYKQRFNYSVNFMLFNGL